MANEKENLTEEEKEKKFNEKLGDKTKTFVEGLADLALMSAKLLVMTECESQGLDDKIEDAIMYNKIVADLSGMYIVNTILFTDRYKKTMSPGDAAMKANDKSLEIIKKNIQMLVED